MNILDKKWWFLGLLVLLIASLSISSHSLWMDEAIRIEYANRSISDGYFDRQWGLLQMGLMHLQYLWGALIGKTEIAYRCLNIPFLLVSAIYFSLILRKFNLSSLWLLVICVHPIVVYYMNDAGPYIILLACSAAVYYHCFFSEQQNSLLNVIVTLIWLTIGFCVHFIYGFAVFLFVCSIMYKWKKNGSFKSINKEIFVGLIFVPLFMYITYMYLLHMGHGAERGWSKPGILNLGFVAYAFSGLCGLGLPRNDIRMGNYHLINWEMIACVSVFCISLIVLICRTYKALWSFLRQPAMVSALILGGIFFLASYSRNFQFWERHMMFLFPMFVVGMVFLLSAAWRKTLWDKLYVSLLVALLLVSSCQLRWVYKYYKDDQKGAYLYVQQRGLFNSDIPVIAQGFPYLYRYYNCRDYSGPVPPMPDNIVLADNFSYAQILQAVDDCAKRSSTICLILAEKSISAKHFYSKAEAIFEEMGFKVTSSNDFNTFKILILTTDSKA